jgi:hypothetical protein
MSEKLWVEYKTEQKVYKHRISFEECDFVADFIEKLKSNTQFSVIKDFEVTLCTPFGEIIDVGESPLSLVPGNTPKNPLHVQVSASLPVSVKPAPDTELTKFWDSLHGMKPENGFLKFHNRLSLLPAKMKELYIRKAYKDLFQIIYNNLNSKNETKERLHRMAITGTPGTGKSMFLFYILWRLANRKTTETVILRRQVNHESIYVFQNNGCWIASYDTDIRMFLNDPTTWYLTDALRPPPNIVEAITILVSSPSEKYYSKFLDYLPVPPLHYLPIWSLKELKLAAKSYSISLEEVEERFGKIGGIARFVLEKNVDLEAKINEKINKLLSDTIMLMLPTSEGLKEKKISHRLVHFKVEPPCYTKYESVMASEYVMKKYARAREERQEQLTKSVLAFFQNIPFVASCIGNMFERYAHQKLSEGGEFLVRSLDDESENLVSFPARMSYTFQTLSECTNPNLYYVAKAAFPCIDSLVLKTGYFQMTVSMKHDINEKMKEIKSKMKMDNFYFVVPHTHYKEFKKQRILGSTDHNTSSRPSRGNLTSSIRVSKRVKRTNKENKAQLMNVNNEENSEKYLVRQFVICIPIGEYMMGWVDLFQRFMPVGQHDGRDVEKLGENQVNEIFKIIESSSITL